MRDDFPDEVKRSLALRVGCRCSRPECGALTAGPQDDDSKAVNVGVAAHITAASPNGPRFDPMLTAEERMAAANGIWLCQNCAKLIDNDLIRFPIEVLQKWKADREAETRRQVGLAKPNELKPDLIVELHVAELVERGAGKTPLFLFKVANPHTRPATICGAGIEAPSLGISVPVFKPQLLVFPRQPALPMPITDGQALLFSESVTHFVADVQKKRATPPFPVIGYVTDALGNRHESEPVMFEIPVAAG